MIAKLGVVAAVGTALTVGHSATASAWGGARGYRGPAYHAPVYRGPVYRGPAYRGGYYAPGYAAPVYAPAPVYSAAPVYAPAPYLPLRFGPHFRHFRRW